LNENNKGKKMNKGCGKSRGISNVKRRTIRMEEKKEKEAKEDKGERGTKKTKSLLVLTMELSTQDYGKFVKSVAPSPEILRPEPASTHVWFHGFVGYTSIQMFLRERLPACRENQGIVARLTPTSPPLTQECSRPYGCLWASRY
jgi:hypothetical protein